MPEITLPVQKAEKVIKPPVKSLQLGDGYEQTFQNAIADVEEWNVTTPPMDDADANSLEDLLNGLNGDVFTWTPPYSDPGTYRLNSKITRTMVSYRRSTLQFSLKKAWAINQQLCIIGGAYNATLSVPFGTNREPRETAIATFTVGSYRGNVLPISYFQMDDLTFVVPSDFNVSGCYTTIGSTRIINLPSNAFVVYDGDNPNKADGQLSESTITTYNFGSSSYSVPAGNTSTGTGINGLLNIGVLAQPHNNIRLSELASRGYILNGIISFKLMHVAHGGGNVTLTIDVPQCQILRG